MQIRILIITLIISLFLSCNSNDKPGNGKNRNPLEQEQNLIKVNRYLIKKDQEIIENFIERSDLDMVRTETGLWYYILEEGNGLYAKKDQDVSIEFTVSLLDGTICYQNDSSNLKRLTLGKGNIETGLEEGLLLLKEGSKAKFILPPHLAHGLVGDDKKIPPRSIIMYDVILHEIHE